MNYGSIILRYRWATIIELSMCYLWAKNSFSLLIVIYEPSIKYKWAVSTIDELATLNETISYE